MQMQYPGQAKSRPCLFTDRFTTGSNRQPETFSTHNYTITVIRAQGYQALRPEKSWRPIVSVVVDDHQSYEVNLGCDGQNPNLKERFIIQCPDGRSRVNINVYYQAQSKRKHKRRCLVATTSLSLQALSKLKSTEHSFKIPLSSSIRKLARGKVASVYLIAMLEVPETRARLLHDSPTSEDHLDEYIMSPASESESDETTNFPCSSSAITPPVSPDLPGIRIRRGYISDTDDDRPLDEHVKLLNESYESSAFVDNDNSCALGLESNLFSVVPSLLPRYTEQISVDNSLSFIDAIVDSFSPYRELREACSDSEFERILEKLNSEWYFFGASLVTLAGLDAAVFGFSSGSLFSVDSFARSSIAIGSVASGIGLAIDGWFLLVYGRADAEKFQRHARDIYGTYLFFCISSRLPAVCMFVSACALMAFLIAVAWSAWPTAVLVMCFMAGVLICLQFIIYGLHCVVVCMAGIVRAVRRGLMWCVRRPSNNVSDHSVSET